jgi:hypothetical protein
MSEASIRHIERRLRQMISTRMMLTPGTSGTATERGSKHSTLDDVAEAHSWFDWLDAEDAALVQTRLAGARWKMICWRFGISRPTAYRRWRHALSLIAWRLNGNPPPARCSRRRFMQLAAVRM